MLSAAEKACMRWSSQGIAILAGRSVAEFELHLSDACISLGVVSLTDAVKEPKSSDTAPKGREKLRAKTPKSTGADVGSRIRSRRRTLAFNQGELGEALGITFQQLQKYEKGANRVGASRLQALASVLGVPIECFFGGNAGLSIGSSTRTDLLPVHECTSFIQSAEAKKLNAAFSKGKSPTVRMRVVSLVKAIASTFPRKPHNWGDEAASGGLTLRTLR